MHLARLIPILALLSVGITANADTLKNPIEARQLADKIMTKVGEGEIEGGLRLAKPFLIIPPAEFDVMIEQMKCNCQ